MLPSVGMAGALPHDDARLLPPIPVLFRGADVHFREFAFTIPGMGYTDIHFDRTRAAVRWSGSTRGNLRT